jgi:hypothetical protein
VEVYDYGMKRILFDYGSIFRSQRRAANDIGVTELVQI